MKWRAKLYSPYELRGRKREFRHLWHKWFAWYPVATISEKFGDVKVLRYWVWLECVDRRRQGNRWAYRTCRPDRPTLKQFISSDTDYYETETSQAKEMLIPSGQR